MLEKTINKVISSKISQWINSIDNENLRNELRGGTIVTGGALVSLIQNEVPNDYDIYLKTPELVEKVALYYCDQFKKRTKSDKEAEVRVEKADSGETTKVSIFIQSSGVASEEDDEDDTFDLSNDEDMAKFLNEIKDARPVSKKDEFHVQYLTDNAISLSNDIQIIIRFWGTPDQIHKNYDFVHTKAYWTSWDGKVVIPAEVYEAVVNKRLIYTGSLFPICSLFRMRKFISRGWNISAGEILKIAWQIKDLNLEDIQVLTEQLIGVDALWFTMLIEDLKETKKNPEFQITESYIIELVDKYFN